MSESIQTRTLSHYKKGQWIENRYIPTTKILTTKEEKSKFLETLHEYNGFLTTAAKATGLHIRSLYRRMTEDEEFGIAVKAVRQLFETQTADKLEKISENCALIDKNATERFFQLNALRSAKYRPKQVNIAATSVHVTIGWAPPTLREKSKKEVKADYTIDGNNKGKTP